MGRPRRCEGARPADLKFVDAFWGLLGEHRLQDMTVGMIVEAAGLSRATFYYHYKDLDALVDRAIELELADGEFATHGIFASTIGTSDALELEESMSAHIRRMALVIDRGGLEEIGTRVTAMVRDQWKDILHPEGGELAPETIAMLEYTVSGNVGLLAFLAKQEAGGEKPPCKDSERRLLVRDFLQRSSSTLLRSVSRSEGVPVDVIKERIQTADELCRAS